ncbi:MAG: plasmid replication/partition protein [Rhodocyclaceae bacterium]|nr:MAG: plasmid replication/partition protein [Rhodocyclaceae bacterium]TND01883.1 MAG: plasmid replication/partition protein [Rhodocyclaceae bacterium]
MTTTTPATAKAATPKTPAKVSHAKTKATPARELPNISSVKLVPLNLIDIRPQVRTVFDENSIHELAEDIQARGLLQPVLLNPRGDRFTLIAGERRVRACNLAGLSDIPALITKASEADALLMQLAENVQRENLELQDEVNAIRLLHDNLKSVQAVAETVKKSSAWVSKRLALSHPDFSHKARNLMERGVTEDVEILNVLSHIDSLNYSKANELEKQLLAGTATRETARQMLKDIKKPPKLDPAQVEREEKQRQSWEEAQEQRATLTKERQEGTGEAFLDWIINVLEEAVCYADVDPQQHLNTLRDDQRHALLAHFRAIQAGAPAWTAMDWARRLSYEVDEHSTYLEQLAAALAMQGSAIDDCYSFIDLAWRAHGGEVRA